MDEPTDADPSIAFAQDFGRKMKEYVLKQAFKTAGEQHFSIKDHVDFLSLVIAQDDRSVAILLFSYFDDFLLECMNKHLGDRSSELFGPSRPLQASRPRLVLAEGLGWIDPAVLHAADLMRKIRNEFAHNIKANHFSDNKVRGWVSSMPDLERRVYDDERISADLKPRTELTPRDLYICRSMFLVAEGMSQLLLRPHIIRQGLPPVYSLLEFRREIPTQVKQLMMATLQATYCMLAKADSARAQQRSVLWKQEAMSGFSNWVTRFENNTASS